MVKGLAHPELTTDRFEETIEFYKKAFGAREYGYFMTAKRAAWITLGDSILEIFEGDKMPSDGAFTHIALWVDSVDESFAEALLAGATVDREPCDICLSMEPPVPLRIAFVRGINGELIEFCEER